MKLDIFFNPEEDSKFREQFKKQESKVRNFIESTVKELLRHGNV